MTVQITKQIYTNILINDCNIDFDFLCGFTEHLILQ
jgi:hypothetical protein